MTKTERAKRQVAEEVKAMLRQRLLRESAAGPNLYDELYVRLAGECDRWAATKSVTVRPDRKALAEMQAAVDAALPQRAKGGE